MFRLSALLPLLLALVPGLLLAADPVLVGRVMKVTDGDTIKVELSSGPISVRFDGVDAPESNQPRGKAATAFLKDLVANREVTLQPKEQDRYERLVATVFVGDVNVNELLVAQGHAWAAREYLERDTRHYCRLEGEARAARRGLWADPPSSWIYPSDWRRLRRKTITSPESFAGETVERCLGMVGKRR